MKYVLELSVESKLKDLLEISNSIKKTLSNHPTEYSITVTRKEERLIYSDYHPKNKD